MSEKICLQWNDFHDNIKIAFANLREGKDFADVTLACEDGQQVEAHKMILAASSPFFQKLLARNKHPQPLIYLRGIKSDDLLAAVDFMYSGEANVFHENLDSFLVFAEELQLTGFMGKTDEKVKDLKVEERPLPPKVSPGTNTNGKIQESSIKREEEINSSKVHDPKENRTLAIPRNFSGDFNQSINQVYFRIRTYIHTGYC